MHAFCSEWLMTKTLGGDTGQHHHPILTKGETRNKSLAKVQSWARAWNAGQGALWVGSVLGQQLPVCLFKCPRGRQASFGARLRKCDACFSNGVWAWRPCTKRWGVTLAPLPASCSWAWPGGTPWESQCDQSLHTETGTGLRHAGLPTAAPLIRKCDPSTLNAGPIHSSTLQTAQT